MSQTATVRVRNYLRSIEPAPACLTHEQIADIADEFGVASSWVMHLVNGEGIPISRAPFHCECGHASGTHARHKGVCANCPCRRFNEGAACGRPQRTRVITLRVPPEVLQGIDEVASDEDCARDEVIEAFCREALSRRAVAR